MISIRNLCVEIGDFTLKNANIDVLDGEYMVMVGPTGAGKTVILESIAGLYPLKGGKVVLRGKDVTALPPDKRRVSIVYQDHALFPHLSVRENILFGLKARKVEKREQQRMLEKVVSLLSISSLLHRSPPTLSGGERQKSAMARALCVEPDLLLLDEPLSALDPKSREDIQEKLLNIKRSLKLTTVHVTHDFEEAIALGDRICVIGEGEVKQTGSPEDIFRRPDSEFVARFAMARNIFNGSTVFSGRGKGCQFKTDGAALTAMDDVKEANRAAVRPEEVVISVSPLEETGMENVFSGQITGISDKGATLLITVDLPPRVSTLVTRRDFKQLNPAVGMTAYVGFPASAVHLFHERPS